MPAPPRELVLVGGGHSHVQVLRMHLMEPIEGVRVTVVLDQPVATYSGMVPAVVAGQLPASAAEIDVRPLARRAGCRVVVARAVGLDPTARRVRLAGRPPLRWDLCSVNVGSTVLGLDLPGVRDHAVPTRPIGRFVARIDAAIAGLRRLDRPARVVVVGAGAAGVELAFCLQVRLEAALGARPDVTLIGTAEAPLPGQAPRVQRAVLEAARERGVHYLGGARVAEVGPEAVRLADGRTLPADLVPWVTGATGTGLFADSGLETDPRGFVRVDAHLQVPGHPGLFAVGDCAVPDSWPEIPKAGVYAVREGPVLMDNLRAAAAGRPLRAYTPQREFLTLLNLGDGTALGARNGLAARGRAVYRLKDRIDRRFMERFVVLDPDGSPETPFAQDMPAMDASEMVCGGCAAKVGEGPLHRALRRLPPRPDPELTLGLDAPDDVAVLRRPGEQVITSVDAFPAFADDPWLVGRVAAENALSDLFAKGVAPRLALAVVTLPEDEEPEEALYQVLAGARVALDAAGATLAGGHTTVGPTLQVGFAVTGFSPSDQPVMTKGGLRPGDHLVLTRPLGTGVLLHADMAGAAAGRWMQAVEAGLVAGNRSAAEIARAHGVAASTDVTGFGLVGHLGEMARASGCGVRVWLDALPALPGALGLLARGERSTFHEQNRAALRGVSVQGEPADEKGGARLELAVDPQTAGGLLLGVAPARTAGLLEALRASGLDAAACIGEVDPAGARAPGVTLTWETPGPAVLKSGPPAYSGGPSTDSGDSLP